MVDFTVGKVTVSNYDDLDKVFKIVVGVFNFNEIYQTYRVIYRIAKIVLNKPVRDIW